MIKLGIKRERSMYPQQNGAHERMHSTLKRHVARPPKATWTAQQKALDVFRAHYNYVRPHEALAMETPGSIYVPSPRRMPRQISPPLYPLHFETRSTSPNGVVRFKGFTFFISEALEKEYVAFEEIDEGVWRITFAQTLLGFFSERFPKLGLIYPDSKRLNLVLPMSPV